MADKSNSTTKIEASSTNEKAETNLDENQNSNIPDLDKLESAEQVKKSGNKSSMGAASTKGRRKNTKKKSQNTASGLAGTSIKSQLLQRIDKFVFFIVRAVIFGLIAAITGVVAVFFIIQYSDLFPSSGDVEMDLASQSQKITELEESVQELSQITENSSQRADEVDSFADELVNIKGQVSSTTTEVSKFNVKLQDVSVRLPLIEDSIAEIILVINEIQSASTKPEQNDELQDIKLRLSTLENEINFMQLLTANQESDQNQLDSPQSQLVNEELFAKFRIIESSIAQIEEALVAIKVDDENTVKVSDLASVESRVEALETNNDSSMDYSQIMSRLIAVESSIEEIELTQDTGTMQLRKFGLIGIRSAIQAGVPYSGLLYESEISREEFPEVVLTYADTGVETLDSLSKDFIRYAREVIASPELNSSDEGLVSAVQKLFRVRPLTPQEGEEPSAVLSRAEEALRRGDLENAVTELSVLSDQTKNVMADWINAAEARLAVLGAIDTMLKTENIE